MLDRNTKILVFLQKAESKLYCLLIAALIILLGAMGLSASGENPKHFCGNNWQVRNLGGLDCSFSEYNTVYYYHDIATAPNQPAARLALNQAIDSIQKHIPIKLVGISSRFDERVKLTIQYGYGQHQCPVPFTNKSTLAHAFYPCEGNKIYLCINKENDYTQPLYAEKLYLVFMHELGHNMGLPHNEVDEHSFMYPNIDMDKPIKQITAVFTDKEYKKLDELGYKATGNDTIVQIKRDTITVRDTVYLTKHDTVVIHNTIILLVVKGRILTPFKPKFKSYERQTNNDATRFGAMGNALYAILPTDTKRKQNTSH